MGTKWQLGHEGASLAMLTKGRSQEFVSEGDKRVGSVTSGVHPGTESRWGLRQSPKTQKKYAENLMNVTDSILFRQKNSAWQFRNGHVARSPLPYAHVLSGRKRKCLFAHCGNNTPSLSVGCTQFSIAGQQGSSPEELKMRQNVWWPGLRPRPHRLTVRGSHFCYMLMHITLL